MAGLIKSTQAQNTNVQKPQVQYTANQVQADERQVDAKSTVAGQMTGLLDKNSDYMKRAETKGLQLANSRGLLNTDFAVSAAHGAAMDAALPIAQQDAQTYNNQSLTNQNFANQSNQLNAQAKNRASEFNASMGFDQWNAERGREQQEFLTRLEQSGRMQQMSAEASANLKGEVLDTWNKIRQDAIISMDEIQMNPSISADDKQKMIDNVLAIRDADIEAMTSIVTAMPQWQQDWAEFTEV